MVGILRRSSISKTLWISIAVLLPLPASCGGDDDPSQSAGKPDAASDASSDKSVEASDGPLTIKDSGAENTSDSPVEGGGGDSRAPIDAQDAAYTIQLGGQVDESLTSQ